MMQKKIRNLVAAATALSLAAIGSFVVVQAREGAGFPGGHFGGPLRSIVRQLDLTDAQRGQIRGVLQNHRTGITALADKAFAARRALRDAVTADVVDESAIRDRSAALAAVHSELAVAAANIRAEVFQILTPEQRAKAADMRSELDERVQQRRERVKQFIEERVQQF
jgi:protein CpxP